MMTCEIAEEDQEDQEDQVDQDSPYILYHCIFKDPVSTLLF